MKFINTMRHETTLWQTFTTSFLIQNEITVKFSIKNMTSRRLKIQPSETMQSDMILNQTSNDLFSFYSYLKLKLLIHLFYCHKSLSEIFQTFPLLLIVPSVQQIRVVACPWQFFCNKSYNSIFAFFIAMLTPWLWILN